MADDKFNFPSIYNDYQPRIRRYMTRLVGENEAEDLTQEVFTRVSRSLEAFRGESQLSTWIYQIATNVARDRFRRSSVRGEGEKILPMDALDESEGDMDIWADENGISSEQQIIRQEMNGCIREIIATLPDAYQSVIVLGELEGMKDAEIADIMGVSLQTAKIRLHRGRIKLKEALTSSCILYRDERNEFACDRKNPLVSIQAAQAASR